MKKCMLVMGIYNKINWELIAAVQRTKSILLVKEYHVEDATRPFFQTVAHDPIVMSLFFMDMEGLTVCTYMLLQWD